MGGASARRRREASSDRRAVPPRQDGAGHPPGDDDVADVIELDLAGHQQILLMQEALHHVGRPGREWDAAGALATVWDRLAGLIEVHAAAEQEVCYLPMVATRSWSREQMEDAVADLAEICEAVAEARLEPIGSRLWWRAVKAALSACAEHFGRQEEEVLADFRDRADRWLRQELGAQWSAFIAARIRDLAADGQAGDAVCQLCHWPMPASHRHVLDTEDCAVLCACHCCYELHGWTARAEFAGTSSARAHQARRR
jgi:hypothetical protein